MSGKHTPGPWVVSVEREGGIGSSARIRAAEKDAGTKYGKTVAYVGGDDTVEDARGRIWERLSDEGEKNARLIAAAPELLSALKGMLKEDVEDCGPRIRCGKCDGCAGRAAIAKARGDQ